METRHGGSPHGPDRPPRPPQPLAPRPRPHRRPAGGDRPRLPPRGPTRRGRGRSGGPRVMIGCGSIGVGTLPLLERHIEFDADRLTVIDPYPDMANWLRSHRIEHLRVGLTPENYES